MSFIDVLNGFGFKCFKAETAPRALRDRRYPYRAWTVEPDVSRRRALVIGVCAGLTVVTLPVSQLNPGGSITICGEVANEGNEPVTERGICWGTTYYPSVTGPHTSDGSGKGYFTTVIGELQPGTLYYFRAYAGTQSGIRYGNTVSVSIPEAPKAPVAPVAPVVPTQPLQGTYNPPMPQPPVMPVQPGAPQQPIAPQPQTVPQQPVAPQQQTAPQQPATSQQQTAPQDTTATQQTTVPEETTPQQPADNDENTETTKSLSRQSAGAAFHPHGHF